MAKEIFMFEEGNKELKALLGGKGANLSEMTRIGLPVPYGFIITSEVCVDYMKQGEEVVEKLKDDILESLIKVEDKVGKSFAASENTLLVSVRSGAKISMPGMMDTILDLGLNDNNVEGFSEQFNDRRFAYDCYRRLIQMFGNVVMGIEHDRFEEVLTAIKKEKKIKYDIEFSIEDLKNIIVEYKKLVKNATGREFPQDPYEQLFMAIKSVFESWNNKRAITYRKLNNIPDDLGTAVNIQMMVYGNKNDISATGVAFSRSPSTGEKKLYGEYLKNAQGEDVVAGIRTPREINEMEKEFPGIYNQLKGISQKLELHYKDVQDMEFTVMDGKLYMLQTRNGKRTADAAIKVAVDFVKEGIIDKKNAIRRIDPELLIKIMHSRISPNAKKINRVIAKGLPASPGAAIGEVVFTADKAELLGKKGKKVILVRIETTPDDINGLAQAEGILTARGGMTSHAAVVARGMGKPCVAGCNELEIDLKEKIAKVGDVTFKSGDIITLDGGSGELYLGEVATIEPNLSEEAKLLLEWADEFRKLGVMANADTPFDAKKARSNGAEGIGLCRTEHMFFEKERLEFVQKMIMAGSKKDRIKYLDELEKFQIKDFQGIFEAMDGLSVTIRLLDPPLHEFLPKKDKIKDQIGFELKRHNIDKVKYLEKMLKKLDALQEVNPMLGHRGVRLGIVYKEIYEMQIRAIFIALIKRPDIKIKLGIMVPLVADINEFTVIKDLAKRIELEEIPHSGRKIEYEIGTMIELPRACMVADEIGKEAEFFSFGTNDLTQTTFGFSRDDAEGKFLHYYLENKILERDPFQTIDVKGVGALMKIAIEKGRNIKTDIKIGVCGEHGGDIESIDFFNEIGLDYVSCSPYRVPVARLSAARAEIG
ncbi:pyruvate, phosphate dikinase [Haliovirga abyssi]|uniref:Pyruvate, phosphate dikinase n=1 Tax=Haliovirga abyssi TaxID=2996794 RepID=A0AAU9DWL7_9FUSO|nr:pyruvate, phosphate dikinase [Haliovirga abyssi]BDU49655.1 pyruvate, phosphate dikinase [Haliovirga abyssi]